MMLFCSISVLLVLLTALVIAWLMPIRRNFQLLTVFAVVVCSFFIYRLIGAYPDLTQYQQKQQEKEKVSQLLQSMDGKQGLINRLQEKVKSQPNSAQGHYLLAKLLASEGKWEEAMVHFKNANHLEPANSNYQINYAYALWQMNHNQFNPIIRDLFQQVLRQNPNQIDALNMLAMDAYQQSHFNEAISYWRRLLQLAPPGSEDARMIEAAVQKAYDSQMSDS